MVKINNIGPSGINPYKRQQNKLDQIESIANKKLDKVEISTVAKDLQSISSIENERQEKVEKLKIQVENGTYKPNSTEIAKGILQFYKK
ncbi:flagellar biosynthesis anti-sigma factor FlgM [Bacillus sp. DTU_2020_1000418_1_SI_GHA_SEK_038]|uniref:flagellar biosynthesis anti-sigma factor FlgM n=1 Tax=Bacillus sp. DTU_2020_1000418_1_SI_GHA_SEK_038 TaxID=3077585 RepID=UPI0028E1E9A6|nr:flagellar biosynthesis anti-sigma factor FlgM [Bacillus sp. DTU_2020_1000418_1_SI_GHA_SEK_038]WNS75096.1 flagellar biosynthesis anti-sigma factor FlgM [Bacillus sp. DTU_2020_1000418_1_SI_GHA_SEK_038]